MPGLNEICDAIATRPTAAPSCTSTECSALFTRPYDEQPLDLRRVLDASFSHPAEWWQGLDTDRRSALTSIYNRMCGLRLWCRVRQVRAVHPGEPPVSIWGFKFRVPGLSVSVDLVTDDNTALFEALISSGASCMDMGAGGSLHAGQASLRQRSTSDSLHVAVGSDNLSDAHVDLFASVTKGGKGVPCEYDVPGTAAHLGREVGTEKIRQFFQWLTSWMNYGPLPIARDLVRTVTSGVQVFPDFELTPTVPQPEPANRGDAAPPPFVGITLRGPLGKDRPQPLVPPESKRPNPDIAVLTAEITTLITGDLERKVRQDALLPSRVRRRSRQARDLADKAGPDEEARLRQAAEEAEEEEASYANPEDLGRELAARMEKARTSFQSTVRLVLGPAYGGLDDADRRAIAGAIRTIALIVRERLPERAAGVRSVVVLFGVVNNVKSEVIDLPE